MKMNQIIFERKRQVQMSLFLIVRECSAENYIEKRTRLVCVFVVCDRTRRKVDVYAQ